MLNINEQITQGLVRADHTLTGKFLNHQFISFSIFTVDQQFSDLFQISGSTLGIAPFRPAGPHGVFIELNPLH